MCRSQIPGKIIDYNPFEVQVWDKDGAIDAFLEHKKLNGVLWNKLIRRELFDGIEFDKTLWYWEDLAVVWKIMKRVNRVVRFNEAKYNFYVHPESMCAKNIVLIVFILALRFGIKLSKIVQTLAWRNIVAMQQLHGLNGYTAI